MPFVKVMIHAVWGTKSRQSLLIKDIRAFVFKHISENAALKNIYLDCINGAEDHVHVLFSLNKDLSISKTLQLIKGESSFWINKQDLIKPHFEWADEYYAVSVSESQLQNVRDYIFKQEEHHKKTTFEQECEEFIKKYGFDKFRG